MAATADRQDHPGRDEQQKRLAKTIAGKINRLVQLTEGVDRVSGWSLAGGKNAENKQPASGVRVTVKEDKVRIDVHIVAVFGRAIPEIARRIQKEAQEMFRRDYPKLHMSSVNVRVDGVRFDQDSAGYRERSVEALEEMRGKPEEY